MNGVDVESCGAAAGAGAGGEVGMLGNAVLALAGCGGATKVCTGICGATGAASARCGARGAVTDVASEAEGCGASCLTGFSAGKLSVVDCTGGGGAAASTAAFAICGCGPACCAGGSAGALAAGACGAPCGAEASMATEVATGGMWIFTSSRGVGSNGCGTGDSSFVPETGGASAFAGADAAKEGRTGFGGITTGRFTSTGSASASATLPGFGVDEAFGSALREGDEVVLAWDVFADAAGVAGSCGNCGSESTGTGLPFVFGGAFSADAGAATEGAGESATISSTI